MAQSNIEIPIGHGIDLLLTLRLGGGPMADNVKGKIRWDGRRINDGTRIAGSTPFTTTRGDLRSLAEVLDEVLGR